MSGWQFDDILRGVTSDATTMVGHELNAAGIARIGGLENVLPAGATSFTGGNIILGGPGSDTMEGRGGDDILDGDRWLNVQLQAPNVATADPSDTIRVNSMLAFQADVFAGRLNPGDISIVRTIQTVSAPTGIGDGVTIDSAPTTLIEGSAGTFEFSATDPASLLFCSLSTGAPSFSLCFSPFDSAPLAEGTWTFMVRAQDSFGNWHQATTVVTVLADTIPPGVSLDSGPPAITTDDTPTFTFSSPDPTATFLCSLSTGADSFNPCGSPVTALPLAIGTWTCKVRAVDPAGNISEASVVFAVISSDVPALPPAP